MLIKFKRILTTIVEREDNFRVSQISDEQLKQASLIGGGSLPVKLHLTSSDFIHMAQACLQATRLQA